MHYILDCDTGIDDALAIICLLRFIQKDPLAHLLGITASYGNVTMEQSARNSRAVLSLFGRDNIPVYPGAEHVLGMRSFEVPPAVTFIHGHNGLADQQIPDSPVKAKQMPAETFMARAVAKYGSDLMIIATGALTNLADALRNHPTMAHKVGKIVLMATAVTVPGSVNAWTEANVGTDPQSASEVLSSGAPLVIVGRDVTTTTLLTRSTVEEWKKVGTSRARFVSAICEWYIHTYEMNFPGIAGCYISDPTAVTVACYPQLVTQTLDRHLRVELTGPTRGRTICDPAFSPDPDPRTQIVLRLNNEKYNAVFEEAIRAMIV